MSWPERFRDRRDAGRRLGERLLMRRHRAPVVLGLPRGGVPVADEVARALHAALDVLVVRKLGMPGQPEVAMGAVGEHESIALNDDIMRFARVDPEGFEAIVGRERAEVAARVRRFRAGADPVAVRGRTAIIVDDGVATGATARVACSVVRALGAARVVLAVPVAAPDAIAALSRSDDVDEVACLESPPGFMAVGMHYVDFRQVADDEVARVLAAAAGR